MTHPSIERAVEILTAASAARAARSDDQAAQLIAGAIDVVLARLAIARRIEDGLVSWRADVEAATLDHGWQIIDRIDALLAPNRPATPAPAPPPFAPVADARLREIAAGEYGPNRQEGKAMARELLDRRDAAPAQIDPDPGTRVRVTVGNLAGFVGVVQARGDDDPPGWSRVRRDAQPRETRLFASKHLAPA